MTKNDAQTSASQNSALEGERSLSGSLIGGAFGFIGIAIFASASYAEKVVPTALWWGNFAAMLSVIMFVSSIFFGGRGWTRDNRKGFRNSFNLQAVAGLFGLVFLALGAAIFAFNPKQETSKPDPLQMERRLKFLETQQIQLQAQLNRMLQTKCGMIPPKPKSLGTN
jgi:hypothetical protein